MYPRKVRLRRTGRSAAADRQETAAPSGAVALHTVRCAGSPHPARLKKNDGTTMACGGHWHTTPAQVKTEKIARHLQTKKVKFLHFFTLIYRADLAIVMIK